MSAEFTTLIPPRTHTTATRTHATGAHLIPSPPSPGCRQPFSRTRGRGLHAAPSAALSPPQPAAAARAQTHRRKAATNPTTSNRAAAIWRSRSVRCPMAPCRFRSAKSRHSPASQGQPWPLAHCSSPRWPPRAAWLQFSGPQRQPCSCAHCDAANRLPLVAMAQGGSFQGQPCSLGHRNTCRCPLTPQPQRWSPAALPHCPLQRLQMTSASCPIPPHASVPGDENRRWRCFHRAPNARRTQGTVWNCLASRRPLEGHAG